MSALHPFKFNSDHLPTGPPSEEQPLTNPMEMLLCRYPIGHNRQNPNFMLIYSRPNPFDEYQDPLYAALTAGSPVPLELSTDPLKKKFWMKTYSENKGVLEKLEAEGILRRTGEEEKQGYITLIAVETVITRGQWAECCAGCGRREQLGDENPRMLRCAACQEVYYCNKECQSSTYYTLAGGVS
jgi:hypothetical protein